MTGFEEIGCVSQQRYNEALRVKKSLNEALSALRSVSLSATRWKNKLQHVNISETKSTILRYGFITIINATVYITSKFFILEKLLKNIVLKIIKILRFLFLFSGEELLQYKDVSFQMLASAFPELLAPYLEFSERIKVEGNVFQNITPLKLLTLFYIIWISAKKTKLEPKH